MCQFWDCRLLERISIKTQLENLSTELHFSMIKVHATKKCFHVIWMCRSDYTMCHSDYTILFDKINDGYMRQLYNRNSSVKLIISHENNKTTNKKTIFLIYFVDLTLLHINKNWKLVSLLSENKNDNTFYSSS